MNGLSAAHLIDDTKTKENISNNEGSFIIDDSLIFYRVIIIIIIWSTSFKDCIVLLIRVWLVESY